MAIHNIRLGTTEVPMSCRMVLSSSVPPPLLEADLEVYDGGITPEPYVVMAGRPYSTAGYGNTVNSTAGAKVSTAAASPNVATAQLTSRWRWLVQSDRFIEGGTRWLPLGGVIGDPSVYSPTVTPHNDPRPDYAFDYASTKGVRRQPAWSFFGSGYGHLYVSASGEPRPPSATLAMVAVLRGSRLPYYGLFEADQQDTLVKGEPLVLRYVQNRLDVFQAERRVVSHQLRSAVNEAVVILVSMDSTTDTGTLVIRDESRTSRTFTAQGLDFVSFYGVLGALGQGTTESPYRFRSFMDLMELDYWPRALSAAEANSQADLLALAYGIGP